MSKWLTLVVAQEMRGEFPLSELFVIQPFIFNDYLLASISAVMQFEA